MTCCIAEDDTLNASFGSDWEVLGAKTQQVPPIVLQAEVYWVHQKGVEYAQSRTKKLYLSILLACEGY
jgi:hypothetical protein